MMDGFRHCAVITGASSGLGAEFARQLSERDCFTVLTGRNTEALEMLRQEIGEDRCAVITADLANTRSCIDLYAKARKYDPDILINNAGFGVYGEFTDTSLSREIEMIDVNIKAMHILFKLFLKDFVKNDRGRILNVSSAAGFLPGPLMATYYASKSYVLRLSQGIQTELCKRQSKVRVSVLCPGPVDTDFNNRAGITGSFKGIGAFECVDYAIDKMFKGKGVIIPSLKVKLIAVGAKLAPAVIASEGAYFVQKRKKKIEE